MEAHAEQFQQLLRAQRQQKQGVFRSPLLAGGAAHHHQTPHGKSTTTTQSTAARADDRSPTQREFDATEGTPFPNVARVVTFSSPESCDGGEDDDELDDISLINTSQISDQSPCPPGHTAYSHRSSLQSQSPPGYSPSHLSPPGGRLDRDHYGSVAEDDNSDDGQPWAMMQPFSNGHYEKLPELLAESIMSTPDVTPMKSNTSSSRQQQSKELTDIDTPFARLEEEFKTPKQHLAGSENESVMNTSHGSQQEDPPTAFEVFQINETDLALDEQQAYLDRIYELEATVERLERHQNEIAAAAASPGVEHGASVLLQLKRSNKTPKTPKPHGLAPDFGQIWDRNQTLVNEVQFAQQTCVELSMEKIDLENRLQTTEERLQEQRQTNERLMEQVQDANQIVAQTQTRSNHDAKRMENLESERLKDKEIIYNLEQELRRTRQEQESREHQGALADALAEARQNKKHVQLVDELQKELQEATKEKTQLQLELDQLSCHHKQLQHEYDAVGLNLQVTKSEHKANCQEMATLFASAMATMTRKAEDVDKSCEQSSTELANRLSSLTNATALLMPSKAHGEQDLALDEPQRNYHSPAATHGSPESAAYFTPASLNQNFTPLRADNKNVAAQPCADSDARLITDELEEMKTTLLSLDLSYDSAAPEARSSIIHNGDKVIQTQVRGQSVAPNGEGLRLSSKCRQCCVTETLYEARVMELKEALDTLNASHELVLDELDVARNELSALKEKTSMLQDTLKSLGSLLVETPSGESDGELESEALGGTPSELRHALDIIIMGAREVVMCQETLRENLASVQKQNESIKIKRESDTAERDAVSSRVEKLLQELGELQKQQSASRALSKRYSAEKLALAEERDCIAATLKESQAQLALVTADRDSLLTEKSENEDVLRRLAEANKLCVTLRDRVGALEDAIVDKDLQLAEANKLLEELNEEKMVLAREASEKDDRFDILLEENVQIRQETDAIILNTEKRLTSLKSELKDALGSGEHFQARFSHVEECLNESRDNYLQLKHDFDDTVCRFEVATRENERAMAQLAFWHEHLAMLEQLVAVSNDLDTSKIALADARNIDRSALALRTLESILAEYKTQLSDLVHDLTEAKVVIAAKENEANTLADKSIALQEKVDKLKEYGRKLMIKCDEWEAYSAKQSAAIAKGKSLYHQMRNQVLTLAHTFEEREHAYSEDRALWEAERQQFTNQFEDISRALLEAPAVSFLNSPPPT